MNMFKNKVDTYLKRADYTYVKNVGHSISQWLPGLLAIWNFALDGNLVKSFAPTFSLLVFLCVQTILSILRYTHTSSVCIYFSYSSLSVRDSLP